MQRGTNRWWLLLLAVLLPACDGGSGSKSALRLALNELLAKPASGDDWVEIYSFSDEQVELEGVTLTVGNDSFTFPAGETIEPKGFKVVYCDGVGDGGKAGFKLSAQGESVELLDHRHQAIDDVTFGEQQEDVSWGRLPDGDGTWQSLDPTPGAPNKAGTSPVCLTSPTDLPGKLVINELISSPTTGEDWIELFNAGTECVDLSGLGLSDDKSDPSKWTFPAETTLESGAYLLVYADDGASSSDGKLHATFKLSSTGEELQLAGPKGTVVVDAVTFPALDPDQSYGRLPDGTGAFQTLSSPTPGAANHGGSTTTCLSDPAALKAKLVINELLSNGSVDPDWIELFNNGPDCVDLSGFTLTDDKTNPAPWTFPAGTSLDSGKYLLVYADDGASSADGKLHATFKLSSSGEEVQLAGPQGTVVIDTVTFPALNPDQSYGRLPNGTGAFQTLSAPTPGATN